MRLVLSPKSMEGIEEKLLKSWSKKSGKNTSKNLKNEKHSSSSREMIQSKGQLYWCKLRVYRVKKLAKHPPTLWKIGDISHFSPLFSKTWSTPISSKMKTYVSIYSENQKTRMLVWAKRKIYLMKGSLVQLLLHRTRRHWTICLLLHFHVTSAMKPHAPPTVTPSPVLGQNWETLARVASQWSKLLGVDACPHTVFIRSSVLRHKSINLLPLGFEVQTKKPSRWFWG
jgi:hypothetical protein